MARRARLRCWYVAAIALAVLGCAPSATPGPTGDAGSAFVRQGSQGAAAGGGSDAAQQVAAQTGSGGQIADRTLVIGIATEVKGFSPLSNRQNKYVEDLVLGNLFDQDEQGRWYPAIAAEHPSIDNGTWKIFDDGTQETTYKIKRGVKWHDGVEFTVHDIIFFWTIGRDKEIPWVHDRVQTMSNMEALDDYTLKVTWNIWEAEADAVELRIIWPVARHILEESYRTDKQRFINHPYWTSEFIGTGPYKLTNLVPGSHMELVANDDYVLGQPKIKHVVVRFYNDANILIAALLGGDAHMTLHGTTSEGGLVMTDGIVLGTRWSETKEGRVLFNPYRLAMVAIQSNPEFYRPASLGDVRVRQALLHAVDRPALVEERFKGFTSVADAWVPGDDPDFPMMSEGLPRFAYDPQRAQRLLADAGWQRGADGMLVNSSGARLELEYRATGSDAETTATVIADYWKRVGIDTQLMIVPRTRASDNEWMAKFPGVRNHEMVSAPVGGSSSRFRCDRAPVERNGWVNHTSNPAGYCTAEMDRWTKSMESAFPFTARMEPWREMMRIALAELPYLPLYFESEAVAVRSEVGGINRVPPKNRGRIGMQAHLWTFVQ